MYRRIVHTLVGALAGYLVGAVVGMILFASVNGFRSVAIVEEPNRNRWAFVAAAAAAVIGGLIAWWRSYGPDDAPGPRAEDARADDAAAGGSGDEPEPVPDPGRPVADGTAEGGTDRS